MHTNMFAFQKPVKKSHAVSAVAAFGMVFATLISGLVGTPAHAHVSEMGLVLLMPTGLYIQTGVWVVALTVIALAIVPSRFIERMFAAPKIATTRPARWPIYVSCLATAFMAVLLWAGLYGSRDPLVNPLPLMIWTMIWVMLMLMQSLIGDIWRILNPWRGIAHVLGGGEAPFRLPNWLGVWPGAAGLLAFACFAFADPAPDDPARLALFAGGYWAVILCACLLWGAEAVLTRCEFLTMTMRRFADLAPIGRRGASWHIGMPGWAMVRDQACISVGVFALLILGVGSYDGLNETFWWLGQIGVNPLEFPGRSALIGITIAGLLAACALLIAVFAAALWLGLAFAPGVSFRRAFGPMALSVLPIGIAYHFAHYLTTAMVNGQYALAALNDPLGVGADWLGLGRFYVTTSFFNTPDGVQAIFLSQATAVVIGHVLSVLVAHAIATRLYGNARQAAISQVPLAAFMIAYTFLGLWLLASPKGA